MATLNLALRFLLELAGFAGAGYAVYQLTDGLNGAVRWILAIGGGLAVIGLWGFVAAPRRQNGLSQAQKDVIGSVILLVIAGAVWIAGQPGLGIGFRRARHPQRHPALRLWAGRPRSVRARTGGTTPVIRVVAEGQWSTCWSSKSG